MIQRLHKILIIAADADRRALRRRLKQIRGARYEAIGTGLAGAGVAACLADPPDCVLIDAELPDGDGLGVLRELNPDPLAPRFPVVLLAAAAAGLAAKALDNGAQNYLVKDRMTADDLHFSMQSAIDAVALRRERRTAAEGWRHSQELLALGVEVAGLGLAEIDYGANTVKLSAKAAELFGFGPEELTIRRERLHATFHPEDRALYLAAIERALDPEGAGWFAAEHRIVRPDGQVRWLGLRKQIYFDRAARPARAVLAVRDVTDRKQIGEMLRFSEERLTLAMKSAQIGSFDWNIATGEIEWSNEIVEASEMSPAAFDRTLDGLMNFIHPLDRERLRNRIDEAFRTGEYECEFRMLKGDGTIRWVLGKGRVVFGDDGRPQRLLGVDVDITERRLAEESLRESRLQTELALRAGNAVAFTWDIPANHVRRLHSGVAALPETDRDTLEGFVEKLHEPDRGLFLDNINRALNNPHLPYSAEYRVAASRDELAWLTETGEFTVDEKGRPVRLVGVAANITLHKEAEDRLRRSEEFSRTVLESNPDCVKILDGEGRLQYMNANGRCLMQIDDFAAFAGRYWWDLWPAEARSTMRAAVARSLGGETVKFQAFCPTAKGTPKWWDVIVSPLNGSDEKFRLISVSRDVTEQKAVEEMLRRSHETFLHLVRNAPFGIYVVDADFRLSQISRGSEKVFSGIEPLIGRDFAEILRIVWEEPFATEAIERFRRTLATGEPYRSLNNVLQRGNVEEVESYDWKIERVTLPDGRDGVVCYFYDLTERLEFEARLRESSERMQLVLNAAKIGIWIYDFKTERIYWSPEHYDIFGVDAFDGRVESFRRFVHPEDIDRVWRQFSEAVERRESYENEFRIVRPGGEVCWVGNQGHAEYDQTGRPVRFLGTAFDISERKNLERLREERLDHERILRQTAEDNNLAKDQFLAVLSHELRSPLNAMLGWTQILETSDYSREMTRRAIDVIARNVGLQKNLIEDLLDVSRIVSGKMRLECEYVSLLAVVHTSLEAHRPLAAERGIEIDLAVSLECDQVFGDALRLQQVVGNLLTNALKFTPPQGRIEITLAEANGRARIVVKDSGIGIDPHDLPFIFERFRQAEAGAKRQFGGLGLGLTIVRHLVELHGGAVTAHSDGEGAGAALTVELPLALRPETRAGALGSPARLLGGNARPFAGRRILAVDDDADSLHLLCFVLEEKGADVTCAGSATEAVSRLAEAEFDLLISDLGMPEMDGYELIRRVRRSANAHHRAMPAIALTGYVSAQDRERTRTAGFQRLEAKPVDLNSLLAAALKLIEDGSETRPAE